MAITIGSANPAMVYAEATSIANAAATPGASDSLLVACVAVDDTSEGDITGISDDQTNSWVQGDDYLVGTQRVRLYYALAPVNAATVVTVTFGTATDAYLKVFSLLGTVTTSPIGTTAKSTATGTAGTTSITPGITTSGIIVWIIEQVNNSVYTALGAGQVDQGQIATGGAEKSSALVTTEIYTAAPGAQSATISKSATWIAMAVEIKAEFVAGFAHSQGIIVG